MFIFPMANGRTQGKKCAARGHKADSKSLKFTIPARSQVDTTKPQAEVNPNPKSVDTPALDLELLESCNWNFSDLPDNNNIPCLDNETLTNAEEDTEIVVDALPRIVGYGLFPSTCA